MRLDHPQAWARFDRHRFSLFAVASAAAMLVAAPTLAQDTSTRAPMAAPSSSAGATKARLAIHLEMARRMYQPQTTPRWALPTPSPYTADGKSRPPWEITTWGPLTGESSHMESGEPAKDYTDEFRMYWSRIPDFHIAEYKVWPTEEGWIARIIYAGTAKDGTPVRAHQVDIATIDEMGKVVRFEWHCDAGEWIRQVWSKASGLSEQAVRETLGKPKGFERLIDISLGRAAAD